MSNLSNRAEVQSIADKLVLPNTAFIDGKFTEAKSGKRFSTINPATGEVLTDVSACDAADVDLAVEKARKSFRSGSWSKKHPSERKAVLIKLAKLIGQHSDSLAVLESLEGGKPIKDCLEIDLPETVQCLLWHAEAADKLYDQMSPSDGNAVGMIIREPSGVVGCVLPWNFPLMMLAWKIGPALAGGNSVIVKPAELTSMTALKVAELALEAGIPEGVLQVLPGLGEQAGQALGLHPDVDVISFTGSTEVGRLFLEYSSKSNLKRITLECGGKNPAVVLSDAKHLDQIAEHVVFSACWNMGQNCTANSRLIVHKSLHADLLAKVMERIKDWNTGDPLDPKNALGAIVSKEQFDKIMDFINGAKNKGGSLLVGGEPIVDGDGLFISPTVFDGVKPDMPIAIEEVFGPVLGIMPVASDEEALALANQTTYGLQASLFTSDVARAHNYARQLEAGTVSVNCYSEGDITTPFGGYKLSGFGGKDNSLQAHDQYTETKTIWINLAEDQSDGK
ncbi:MAG: aldehyde dehydrogenase [Parvularculales bacterium]